MSLFSKNNLKFNQYGLMEEDMCGRLKGFPIGVVVRMLEEQELQGNKPDVKVFQEFLFSNDIDGGFDWCYTEAGHWFWNAVLINCRYNLFFKKYPEYEMYNIS